MDQIRLANMAFFGRHGVMTEEQALGQRFFVDVVMRADLSRAGQSDAIQDTIHYGEVYEVVRRIMEGESYQLLERVATVIAETVRTEFPLVEGVTVTIRKPSAPIPGILDFAEVTIHSGVMA